MQQVSISARLLVLSVVFGIFLSRVPPTLGFRSGHNERRIGHKEHLVPRYRTRRLPAGAYNGELIGVSESRGDSFHNSSGVNIPQLLSKAGITARVGHGIYALLPVGEKIMRRLSRVIRVEMARLGAQECSLPILQPEGTIHDRLPEFGLDLFKLSDRTEKLVHLSPTCEELVCHVARSRLTPLSRSHLPLAMFQINTKFRDEMRPSAIGMRWREFLMKDAYSFHADEDSSSKAYDMFEESYKRIMDALRIDHRVVKATKGESKEEEFRVTLQVAGELVDLEVAHLFQLGTHLTKEANLLYEDKGREQKPVYLNSYGIGMQRLLYAAVAQHCDKEGLKIPQVITPYDVAIVPCEHVGNQEREFAQRVYLLLAKRGLQPFLDDRNISVKQCTEDLRTIGIPHVIYISRNSEASCVRALPEGIAEMIKAEARESNKYQQWQSPASTIANDRDDKFHDIMDRNIRYTCRKHEGEFILPVSTLLSLLQV